MAFKITGRVYEAESGIGISNVVVKALDRDLIYDDILGEAIADGDGTFEITYDEEDYQGVFEGNPDLYLVVKTPHRATILYTSQNSIRREAGTREQFEVAIPRSTLGNLSPKAARGKRQGAIWSEGESSQEANIYQRLWECDENQFSVSARTPTGEWENPDADILLDEQVRASGEREIDLATHPLFSQVNEDKLFDPSRTYVSFIQLLDNYAIRSVDPEFTTDEEEAEQQQFLSLIFQTKPIQLALEYINQEFGENLSETQFKQKLQRIWFELYTNYYRGQSTHFASGFEHVFVGEGKFDRHAGDKRETLGTISGYHSWVKFYLDEKNQRVNYLGYKYDLQGEAGPANPNVVTLQQSQIVTNMRGEVIARLLKKKGGFFVGPSPECEMAIATVVYYESVYGRIRDQKRVTLNGATYDLVLYRSVNPNGSRGEFIRSFFPIFLKLDGTPEPEMDRPVVVPVEETLKNDGVVAIAAALPNPRGLDDGNEWVELQNQTNAPIDLAGWQLQDKVGRPELLSGTLPPNEVQRFTISRSSPTTMQLSNKAGIIALFDGDSTSVARVRYSHASSGEIIRFSQ